MKEALTHLLSDLLSAILFFAIYLITDNIVAAAAIAIVVGLAQFARAKLAGRRIEPMQWMILRVVLVLGTATMLTQSPRFMMVKPSIGHFAVALIMLRRGWMTRYLPEIAVQNLPEGVVAAAGYAWAGLLAAIGIANLGFAAYGDVAVWAWFVSVGSIGAKIVAFALQYAVFRTLVRRNTGRRLAMPASGNAAPTSSTLIGLLVSLIVLANSGLAGAVGFQRVAVPDSENQPLDVAIWYPSGAPATPQPLGLFRQSVARDGPVSGSGLPLVVISHGTGGSGELHYDTALALAKAGYVAAAVTHTGDNSRDQAYSFTWRNFFERPRHLKLAMDYLLNEWSGRNHVAAARIGAFGHSAGGFSVLVAIGGEPDLARISAFCREHPEDWGCRRARERIVSAGPVGNLPQAVWVHDERIKVAAVAATAAGHAFTAAGLAAVKAPVQLWQAEDDRIVPQAGIDNLKSSLPAPPEIHLVPAANHFAFLAPCSDAFAERAPEICRDAPGFDRAEFHQDFNRAIIGFFESHLAAR